MLSSAGDARRQSMDCFRQAKESTELVSPVGAFPKTIMMEAHNENDMRELHRPLGVVAAGVILILTRFAVAQTSTGIPPAILTPDKVETRLGTFDFKDGAPSQETVEKVYDNLDLMHGVESFVNAYQGASVASLFKGFNAAGVPNNTALIWSELMDSKSLFLTANADTIYFWVNLDLSKGPMVVETPPLALGVMDDIW